MQKIDFVKNLNIIVSELKSEDISNLFQQGLASGPQAAYDFSKINPFLFLSKSNYDWMKMDNRYSSILQSLGAGNFYSEENLSFLTSILRNTASATIAQQVRAVSFYNFHNALIYTLKLSKEVLLSSMPFGDIDNSIDNGIVIFQIIIDGPGLEMEKYIKIFTALETLILTISKVHGDTEEKSEVVLLDSGSDTNAAIKTGVETAKSLFLIFKEIWDYITSFKFYKQKQQNQVLLESLSIRAEIKDKVNKGILTEEEGAEYLHLIKTRTDDLIGMKVLPKQIVIETNKVENRKLLEDFEGFKLLGAGE